MAAAAAATATTAGLAARQSRSAALPATRSPAFNGGRSALMPSLPLRCRRRSSAVVAMVAAPARPTFAPAPELPDEPASPPAALDFDAAAPPPFSLADIRAAIPKHCWQKDARRSVSYLARDVAIVAGLAVAAVAAGSPLVWPLYWAAQGTMFWALFVLGHDCGHGSFSNNKRLNDVIGHITHSSILVPYHGWRISHRTHHGNHGHVENDESWHPMTKDVYENLDTWARVGRLGRPWALLAYPFYLWKRSPGKEGSHFDPDCDLFTPGERKDVLTSSACWFTMLALVAGLTLKAPLLMLNLYIIPYWINVIWLDVVTYLHHHGYDAKVPWYRGKEWSYMRGGLSTIDRDYGIFNKIHHDIGTHVVHHLFPQIPHYHLQDATEAVKPVMGKYYREPEPSKGWFPSHLLGPLFRSFKEDLFVANTGDIVYYQNDASQGAAKPSQ